MDLHTEAKAGNYERSSFPYKQLEDPSLQEIPPEEFNKEKDFKSDFIDVEVTVDEVTLEVKVDGKQVLHLISDKEPSTPEVVRSSHKGVTLVALHPSSGDAMLINNFRTDMPCATLGLLNMLNTLQAGRLLVLVAPNDWKRYVTEEESEFLEKYLGGGLVGDVCNGEMWAGIATVDGPMWAEAATTLRNYTMQTSKPLRMAVSVPRAKIEQRCEWYADPQCQDHADFCETYEGYDEFCSCNLTSLSPIHAHALEMKEQIPIVIASSRHQFKVLKQIRQLWSQAGGSNTSILLSVDGLQKEGRDFAKVLGIPVVFHRNPAVRGTIGRISEHIKFTIWQGFKAFPKANKLIILEDDLLLAPDFISYFHQTAILLDVDKTIFSINAYNFNSFVPTAIDTSRLYREAILPSCGWMITRELSHELLEEWPYKAFPVDWDLYVRVIIQKGRSVIAPEVPRTFHDGHGGAHATGWEQQLHFNRRPLNMDPHAKVNISYLTLNAYESFLEKELKTATVIQITEHPCKKQYIPKKQVGSFIIYYHGETENDEHTTYFTLISCLNGFERSRMEHYHLVHQIGYYGNRVYVIACPGSVYCNVKEEDYSHLVYNSTNEDLQLMLLHQRDLLKPITNSSIFTRYMPQTFEEEVTMKNYVIVDHAFSPVALTEYGKMEL